VIVSAKTDKPEAGLTRPEEVVHNAYH
jgi:hypothetical protein